MGLPYSSVIAVLAAALVNLTVGFIWYWPVFGKAWRKLAGVRKRSMKGAWKRMIPAGIAALVMSYVLGIFVVLTEATTWQAGAVLGFLIWFGFLATTMINVVLWERKPFRLYMLNAGNYLVSLPLMGAILAVMI